MKKIAVLFGGRSPEYEVSLRSAAAVLAALDREKYEPIPVGITRGGAWLLTRATPERIARDAWMLSARPCLLSPDPVRRGIFYGGGVRILPDLIIPMLHGGAGEDGRVQGLLSLSGIPFLGPRTEGAALAMNKATAKLLAREAGVPTLSHLVYGGTDPARLFSDVAALGYPVFVKPNRGGSSVGAGVVTQENALLPALARAMRDGDEALIEPYFPAREIEVAILQEKGGLRISPAGEILTGGGFYDYETKYQNGRAKLLLADLTPDQNTRVRTYAEKVFRALGLSHLARVDFFLSHEGDAIYFNEVNTLPGFTEGSMYPRLFAGEGGLSSLLDALIEAALAP